MNPFHNNFYALCASCVLTGTVSTGSPAQMFKPSKQEQLKAGKEYSVQIRKENKVLPDSDPRVQLLRKFGERILATRTPDELKKEPWEFSFDVIEKIDFHEVFCFIHHNNPKRKPVFSPMVPLGGPSALIR